MKLVKSKWTNRYWIEDETGRKVTTTFKISARKNYGAIICIVTDTGKTYLITSDRLFENHHDVIGVEGKYYVIRHVFEMDLVYSTYDASGNLVADDMRIFSFVKDGLRKVLYKGRIGYMDEKFNWKIEPKYLSEPSSFSRGIALVEIDFGTYVPINTNGDIVGPNINYSSISVLEYNRILVTRGKRKGIIDYYGNEIIPISYDNIERIGKNLKLTLGNKFGIADVDGNIIVECKYDKIIEEENKYIVYECYIKEIPKSK